MSRVRWQCRRGMLELDFMFHRFYDHHYAALSPEKKILFEKLLQYDDPILFDWLVTGHPCSDPTLQNIIYDVTAQQHSHLNLSKDTGES